MTTLLAGLLIGQVGAFNHALRNQRYGPFILRE